MTSEPPTWPGRDPDGHKGTFGTVCVLGGQCADQRIMIGGPAMTALAALRTGCGLAVLAMPEPILPAGLTIAPPATGIALPVDGNNRLRASDAAEVLDRHLAGSRSARTCLAIGPGFGYASPQQQIIWRLMARDDRPLVIDADAINALAEGSAPSRHPDLRAPAVFTPHPGEYRRLATAMRIDGNPTDPDRRPDAAAALARRLGAIVVLKGRNTVVSDGMTTWINNTGNATLATAGTGDVLTGIIASLIAQFFHPDNSGTCTGEESHGRLTLLQCAMLGVYAHGRAADLWSNTHGDGGLLCTDLLDLIPAVRSELTGTKEKSHKQPSIH